MHRLVMTSDLLDQVRMSSIDRERALAHMRSAEATIDFVAAVIATVRSTAAIAVQGAGSLLRRIAPKRPARL